MKKNTILIIFFLFATIGFSQVQQATVAVNPSEFRINQEITLTFSGIDPTIWNSGQPNNVYLWAWYGNFNGVETDSPTNGSWTNSDAAQQLTNNGNGTYSYTFIPSTLFGSTNIATINFLVKANNGDGDKKSQNMTLFPVFNELTKTSPVNYISVVNSGNLVNIAANTTETSNYTLRANGNIINASNGITNYSFDYSITEDIDFILEANDGHTVLTETFKVNLTPANPVPNGMLDGLNLDPNNPSKATFVLYAPKKTTAHLIGDFNGWQTNTSSLMKKDTARDRFWIELTGLSAGNHTYQYVIDNTIKIADPYSTIILDPNDDTAISATTYPNLATYPAGQTYAVSLFNTNPAVYNWQVTNFQKPAKTDLVVYEILIRDFDTPHSFNAVKARLDYLEALGINAIELMPVNEFDGNISWGYNPTFHMALDKYYGTTTALKELIDECHKRGIAVILDVVYNQAHEENPFFRLWNTANGAPSGQATVDNPFFNQTAKHAFNVFQDFNHQSQATREYVKRTTQYWIEEFKIDGFRWDLTKGFTQNCTSNDGGCTDRLQLDRVNVLKKYADYQWELDPNSYVIFEHLGGIQEEKLWANYRADEGKGIMLWNNLNNVYNEATMGYHDNGKSNFSNVSSISKGFDNFAAVSYMESHDEERLMYKNLNFANTNGYNVKVPNNALGRMEITGAFFFTIPGPKMIWQFGELGYEISIFSCNGGAPPTPYKDNDACKLNEKPNGWGFLANSNRTAIYNTWARLIDLKLREPIFKTTNLTMDLASTTGLKSIHLTLENPPTNAIEHITILGNFGVTEQNISTNFQVGGTWYDLMDESGLTTISGSTSSISLQPGDFRVFGNKTSTLGTFNLNKTQDILVHPNPTKHTWKVKTRNQTIKSINIYNVLGKHVLELKPMANEFEIDASQLDKGIYFVKFKTVLGIKTLKLVKD